MLDLYVGTPETTGQIPSTLLRLKQPTLVSAGALWQPDTERFRPPGLVIIRMLRKMLDSSGFVRGKGGAYPWTVEQYADLGCQWGWDAWAQMDLCCEEAIAPHQAAITARVIESAKLHIACAAAARRHIGKTPGAQAPFPVLQGRRVDDYTRSADLLATACGGALPAFVGVGSMCTRPLRGEEGLLPIVEALDQLLPAHVTLHLFGVKGVALRYLLDFPRVVSVDSMAWDKRASWLWDVEKVRLDKSRTRHRIAVLRKWIEAQQGYLSGQAINGPTIEE